MKLKINIWWFFFCSFLSSFRLSSAFLPSSLSFLSFDISISSMRKLTKAFDHTESYIEVRIVDYSKLKLPKLIAFDLDGTVWTPDMYQLWGGGSPFQHHANGKDLVDRAGQKVQLIGITAEILNDIYLNDHFAETKLAWVSCTDEPEWADECLEKFRTSSGHYLKTVVDSSEIYKSNKQTHFRNLKHKFPGISFEEMLFFDNEHHNIQTVSKLGVRSVYCPDGMTAAIWEEGLKKFHNASGK
jgi:magnesium-dependent phosphatase 1